jgi:hypothetical protein
MKNTEKSPFKINRIAPKSANFRAIPAYSGLIRDKKSFLQEGLHTQNPRKYAYERMITAPENNFFDVVSEGFQPILGFELRGLTAIVAAVHRD